jgi:hypothetical protein
MQTVITALALHYVGNKHTNNNFLLSKNLVPLNEALTQQLNNFYLSKFNNIEERYAFTHANHLKFNEVFTFAQQIFTDPTQLLPASKTIATVLFNSINHPNIKSGELHVCYITNYTYHGKLVNAIGIFKTDTKQDFFEITATETESNITPKQGVEAGKFDKGCLIFNTNQKTGYELAVFDANKKEETKYWIDDFLSVTLLNTHYTQTNEILNLTKKYITQNFATEFKVDKADQIDLLNRSIDYFKSNDVFEQEAFETEVFHHKNTIQSFKAFKQLQMQEHQLFIEPQFDISENAVKKQQRVFKSVVKLDKNFHIYIHGNRQLIEKGIEQDGRKFYKIYFDEET